MLLGLGDGVWCVLNETIVCRVAVCRDGIETFRPKTTDDTNFFFFFLLVVNLWLCLLLYAWVKWRWYVAS